MAKYLISFPSAAMVAPEGEWEAVGRDAHGRDVLVDAAAEDVDARGFRLVGHGVRVAADGSVAEGGYPWARPLDGGFTVLEVPSREEAVAWAARIAKACRCDQGLRVIQFEPRA